MSTQLMANLGPKGRVVIPQSLRQRHDWRDGTTLVFVDDVDAVRVMSATDALARFRASVAGTSSPVDDLIAERRRAAQNGD